MKIYDHKIEFVKTLPLKLYLIENRTHYILYYIGNLHSICIPWFKMDRTTEPRLRIINEIYGV